MKLPPPSETASGIARRALFKAAGAASGMAVALPGTAAQAQTPAPSPVAPQTPEPMLALSPAEAAFLAAVYDTLIPADALSPSGSECGLVTFIDRQLAGAWGNGAGLYRSGPFIPGKPEQGYQLSLTPREYFAAGIKAANAYARNVAGKDFDRLVPGDREAVLVAMESGKAQSGDFSLKEFFEALYASAMEGFFSDPIYGGNRDKVSWRMIGYPGLPATYANVVEHYLGKTVDLPSQSIADFI